MKRQALWLLLVALLALGPVVTRAQNEQPGMGPIGSNAQKPPEKPLMDYQFYKLSFALRELEDGKVLNTRSYVTNMRSETPESRGAEASVRAVTKIPVPYFSTNRDTGARDTQWQYQDVGVSIDCRQERPDQRGPATALRISMDISSVAPVEGGQSANPGPPIRSVRGSASVPFVLDKPLLVTSVDDVTSKRQYQLEVTITKK